VYVIRWFSAPTFAMLWQSLPYSTMREAQEDRDLYKTVHVGDRDLFLIYPA
jgi:hypothetical protein